MSESTSNFVRHIPCSNCGSSDCNAEYDDGHQHCHCCDQTIQPDGAISKHGKEQEKAISADLIPRSDLSIAQIPDRNLDWETCNLFGYGTRARDQAQVATYYDYDKNPVGQKLRKPGKVFSVLGDVMKAMPFGAQLWPRMGKKIVVTEGEIDAMSVSQAQGNLWPVVSIAGGAGNQIRKYMSIHREYFKNFEQVILMFDQDEVGQKAAKDAALALSLPYGQVRIASLPLKDANEMLKAVRIADITRAIWNAPAFQPGGFVRIDDVRDKVLKGTEMGQDWYWPTVTQYTYGKHPGDIYVFGAGTGVGKSSLMYQEAGHIITKHHERVGMIMLEASPAESVLRISAAVAGKPFFAPDGTWTEAQLIEALDKLSGMAFFYDHFGGVEWEPVEAVIRYWAGAEGVKHIFIDHLTAFAVAADDERRDLDKIMGKIGGLAKELNVIIYLISHLARPKEGSHEEGARVELRHLRGSNAIAMWATHVFALERNQQADKREEQMISTFRFLKDRQTGRSTGKTIEMEYHPATARLEERHLGGIARIEVSETHGLTQLPEAF